MSKGLAGAGQSCSDQVPARRQNELPYFVALIR